MDQPDLEISLRDAARLPHPPLVEAHEIGTLSREIAEQHFGAPQLARQNIGQVEEFAFHVASRISERASSLRLTPHSSRTFPAEHFHVREQARGRRVSHVYDLVGLALAAVE